MKFVELLAPEHVVLGAELASLDEGVRVALAALGARPPEEGTDEVVPDATVRANEQVIIVAVVDDATAAEAAIVQAREPFSAPIPAEDALARCIVLLRVPGSIKTVKVQWFPAIARAVREEGVTEALIGASTPDQVLEIEGLMEAPMRRQLLVEDVMSPLSLRVFGDTPIEEVVDLIVRRSAPNVPVVGEDHELLGLIDARAALRELLPDRGSAEEKEGEAPGQPRAAKDVMNRAVMCVDESQPLFEAAHLMVKRDVEQLPVVREGRLVGFVNRDQLLKTLHEL